MHSHRNTTATNVVINSLAVNNHLQKTFLFAACNDNRIRIYDAVSLQIIGTSDPFICSEAITDLAIYNNVLYAGCIDGSVLAWKINHQRHNNYHSYNTTTLLRDSALQKITKLSVNDHFLIVSNNSGTLSQLDLSSKKANWQNLYKDLSPLTSYSLSRKMILANDFLIKSIRIGNHQEGIELCSGYNKNTQTFSRQKTISCEFSNSISDITIHSNMVYACSANGILLLFNIINQSTNSYTLDYPIKSICVDNSHIYIGRATGGIQRIAKASLTEFSG